MDYVDGTKGDVRVLVWTAAWDNPNGDRVEYWLKYEHSKESGPTCARPPLQVDAHYGHRANGPSLSGTSAPTRL
jgi:hypothetical protein